MPYQLTDLFKKTICAVFEHGEQWLNELPSLLAHYAERWNLELLPPYDLSYNYVAPARREDGTMVVLKLGVPRHELLTEKTALELYAAAGAVRLLAHDIPGGALLLEHLHPGERLTSIQAQDDDQATLIAADIMQQLWRPAPAENPFPHISSWFADLESLRPTFAGGTGPFPTHLVAQAEDTIRTFLAAPEPEVVLHGDLHHYNILSAQRAPWLMIDPKGIIGEPSFEIGTFIRNPLAMQLGASELQRLVNRRLDLLSERLELDRERMRRAALAQIVLEVWWDYKSFKTYDEYTMAFAHALEDAKPKN